MEDYHPARKMKTQWISRFFQLFILCQMLCFLLPASVTARNDSLKDCQLPGCALMSQFVRVNRDNSVNPCEDFYQYACGNFINTYTVPEGLFRVTASQSFHRRLQILQYRLLTDRERSEDSSSAIAAKRQFKACMDEDELDRLGLTQLLNIVQENGGWPMIVPGEFNYTKGWQEIHDTYTRISGKGALYSVLVHFFKLRSPPNVITIDQPSQFPAGGINNSNTAQVDKFVTFIVNVSEKFAEANGASIPRERLEQDARDLYRFLTQIEELRNPHGYRDRGDSMTVQQANQAVKVRARFSPFNLLTTLQTLYRDVENVTITEADVITVREMDYMKELLRLIEQTDRRVLLNYLQFHFVEHYIGFTTREMRNFIYEVYDTAPLDRVVVCASMPNIEKALSRMYVKEYVLHFTTVAAYHLFRSVKEAIAASILRTSFLDNSTREEALSKLENLVSIVGYDDFYDSDAPVDNYYSQFTMGTNFLSNILNYNEVTYRDQLASVNSTNQGDDYRTRSETPPISTSLTYRLGPHRLEIPAGALNPPAYHFLTAPLANYAGLGSMVALLLSDLYIDLGMFVNDQGNVEQWVSNTTLLEFEERTQCYVDQYKNYTIKELDDAGIHYKPRAALSRPLLASLHFSLKYAYEAYKVALDKGAILVLPELPELNAEQQFFLTFASIHCESVNPEALFEKLQTSTLATGRTKVNTALQNSPAFSRSFNCPVGSPMNPPKKCAWFD